MNQELMTLDFWQDTVIYEDKTLPTGTLACDALNVSADTLARMNEQCDKINLLLGKLNDAEDASTLFPMVREAALTMLDILSVTPPFSYMDIPKHRERIQTVFTAENAQKYVEFAIRATTNSLPFEEVPMYADAVLLQRYTAVFGHLAYSLGEYQKLCLILQKKRMAMKQTVQQKDLQSCLEPIFHRSSPLRRAMPGWLHPIILSSMFLRSVPAMMCRCWSSGCTS